MAATHKWQDVTNWIIVCEFRSDMVIKQSATDRQHAIQLYEGLKREFPGNIIVVIPAKNDNIVLAGPSCEMEDYPERQEFRERTKHRIKKLMEQVERQRMAWWGNAQ